MPHSSNALLWGEPPWKVHFHPESRSLTSEVDFAVVGGGFSGLSAAAWLRRLDPRKSVVLLEASTLGFGASGRTGGMVLSETAAGDLPGLGDVLAGFSEIVGELEISCDLSLPGAWEIGRGEGLHDSPISWNDSGQLRVVNEVPGGTVDAGKLLDGLAHAAHRAGALILENACVDRLHFDSSSAVELEVAGHRLRATKVLLATNAMSLELSELADIADPKFTLAVATGELSDIQLHSLGIHANPFYTVDLPYLWGRLLGKNCVIFGAGLVELQDWRQVYSVNATEGETAQQFARLEQRVRGLHPALNSVSFANRWGGSILIGEDWEPVFRRHARDPRVIVLGAYSGHGVALSVYLGKWAAQAMLEQRELPAWNSTGKQPSSKATSLRAH